MPSLLFFAIWILLSGLLSALYLQAETVYLRHWREVQQVRLPVFPDIEYFIGDQKKVPAELASDGGLRRLKLIFVRQQEPELEHLRWRVLCLLFSNLVFAIGFPAVVNALGLVRS